MLSGIQHFAFCPRQWALIHIEQVWRDNVRTVDGDLFHQRAHNREEHELRGDLLILRGLHIRSLRMGISGICDIVEFHRVNDGIPLRSYEGLWCPYPVEYKKGAPKENDADRLQLCAQAMCLEEMLSINIPKGALFYGEIRRREEVVFSDELRIKTESTIELMQKYFNDDFTPKPKRTKACNACSLVDICVPAMTKALSVQEYIRKSMEDCICENY